MEIRNLLENGRLFSDVFLLLDIVSLLLNEFYCLFLQPHI